MNCHACIGGKSLGNDLKTLERGGVQVVSGTPGRVYDLVKRNALQMGNLKAMVLDEADEMLSRGFKEQIYDIYRCVDEKQGATFPSMSVCLSISLAGHHPFFHFLLHLTLR